MPNRELGWYHVRLKGGWTCSYWSAAGEWLLLGPPETFKDSDFVEIGPRIPEPGSAGLYREIITVKHLCCGVVTQQELTELLNVECPDCKKSIPRSGKDRRGVNYGYVRRPLSTSTAPIRSTSTQDRREVPRLLTQISTLKRLAEKYAVDTSEIERLKAELKRKGE